MKFKYVRMFCIVALLIEAFAFLFLGEGDWVLLILFIVTGIIVSILEVVYKKHVFQIVFGKNKDKDEKESVD